MKEFFIIIIIIISFCGHFKAYYRYIHHVCKENISLVSVHLYEALLLNTEMASTSSLFSLFTKRFFDIVSAHK